MSLSIPIIIADAQYLTRLGLKLLLAEKKEFEVVDEVSDEEQLLESIKTHNPEVVVLDYNQTGKFSPSTVNYIKEASPKTRILIISADSDKKTIDKVLEYGVNCFLTKSCEEDEIYDAINAAAKGEKFFCTNILDYLLEKSFAKEEVNCAPTPLTPRELEIVRLVAKGLIAKEIADVLHLSTHTIYTHRKNIMKKLSLNTSSELVLYAFNNGLVSNQ